MDLEDFVSSGEVKKQVKDLNLNKILISSAIERKDFLEREVKTPKYILENVYDIIRELIEARLALEGYKSYSHHATILFLNKFKNFSDLEVSFIDDLRKFRHKLKYYGKTANDSDSFHALSFLNKMFNRLKNFAEGK